MAFPRATSRARSAPGAIWSPPYNLAATVLAHALEPPGLPDEAPAHARRRRRITKPAFAQENPGRDGRRRAGRCCWHRLCVSRAVPPPARGGRREERTAEMIATSDERCVRHDQRHARERA